MDHEKIHIERDYTICDLENILDNIPYEVWLKDKDGNYKFINKAFAQRIKLSKEEIIGKKDTDFNQNNIIQTFNKNDKKVLTNKIRILQEDKLNINKDVKWFKVHKLPFKPQYKNSDWIMSFSREISLYKKVDNILKSEIEKGLETEKELELFLETATDLCAIVSTDGTYKKVTSKWTRTLGWNKDELFKMKLTDLIHKDDIDKSLEIIDLYSINGKGYGLTTRFRCKNGEYKIIEWSWNYIEKSDSIILTGKDRTEQKKLEEEKKILEDAIALETLKTEFFANISHEFRTPINIILTTVQLLSVNLQNNCTGFEEKANLTKYIKGLKQNAYRLLKLVNNLLDITKIEGGYYELKLKNCNVINLIEEIVLSVADHIGNKGRTIIFDTNEEELTLACDPERIETIILNLLSNAVKYTEKNGEINVNLNVDKKQEKIFVSVKDNGVKIDEKYAKSIFDRFTQVENLLNRKCEGSGIGLSLVKSLVELHGGTIWANTDLKEGAEIIFTLPIKEIENQNDIEFETKVLDAKIERFNVEFSDIYSM
ncbi:sensor histidine kinase [Clostridium weizhouense]|uniref:histidine kinase n=1 Tax=Clostridium weizhouense TaxID=2859781 RepID=A0ABS7AJ58_9CLOT|nr:ATP-binding protein [Clostridium weizhouense]MBW6408672.1 PAS domain S-box protein [Clostridium weizhouense]